MEDPDVRSDKQLLTVQPINFDQRVLSYYHPGAKFFYGDWLLVEGKLKQPEDFEGFDLRVFGAVRYLRDNVLP